MLSVNNLNGTSHFFIVFFVDNIGEVATTLPRLVVFVDLTIDNETAGHLSFRSSVFERHIVRF